MKNSKLRRVLMLLACAVLLVCLSVGATLAYLTSTTQVVQNTFTVGNVTITLDEKNTDGKDKTGAANANVARDDGNKYHLQPGLSYEKDPTVHVDPTSEDCYVRMIVTVGGYEYLDDAFAAEYFADGMFKLHEVVDGWDAGTWVFTAYDATEHTYEFRYYKIVETGTTDLEPLFTHIVIPGDLTNEQVAKLANVQIDVIAHAIQADGFVDEGDVKAVDKAWTAFDGQN